MHIPHSNKDRVLNFKGYIHNTDLNESVRDELSQGLSGNELEWNVEYVLAERHINTNIQTFYNSTSYYVEPKTKWDIIQLDNQNYIANMI